MIKFLINQRFKLILGVVIVVLVVVTVYKYVGREVVIYANANVDGYGFRASVTCRPDQMLTYYPYMKIQAPNGAEVARLQIHGRGYEGLSGCLNSFPVQRLEFVNREAGLRVYFSGRNAFGDADSIVVPIHFYSPR